MTRAAYTLYRTTADAVTIRDVGRGHCSVTNDAEAVVASLAFMLNGRRLFYYDSEGQLDELLHKDGVFTGFAPGPRAA